MATSTALELHSKGLPFQPESCTGQRSRGSDEEMDCISCGLELPPGLPACPACHVEQRLASAIADDARCARHADVRASTTCVRCGAFLCVACDVAAEGRCPACVAAHHRTLTDERAKTQRRLAAVVVAQALLGPLTLVASSNTTAAAVLGVLGLIACLGAAGSVVRPRLFDLALVFSFVAAVITVWLVPSHPAALLPLGVAVTLAVQLGRASRLERDEYRAQLLLQR